MITAVVTPYQGSTVASLEVVFDSDNAQFLEALATAGYSNNTVALWPGENPAGDYCVVKQSGSDLLVKVNYNGMKGLYDHTGTHTAKFIAIDSEGRRSYTTMTIKGHPRQRHRRGERWKMQIAKFIKEERIEKPILVGHSMGGGLALAIAAEFPELTGKIVIVDALPCLMALRVPDFKIKKHQTSFEEQCKMSAATLTTDSLRFTEIVNWGLASDRKTYAKLFCDFSNTDLRECIKNIVVPSLVLLEPYFKHIDTVIKNQYKNLSVAQIRYADKGLHFVMFDDREWFIHQICEFIKER